jgi:homoserine dehydrogenase
MKIGLLGYGTVGAGVYRLVDRRSDMEVKYVLDLRDFDELGEKLTHAFPQILEDKEIDTVVEVMGGLHPSYEFATAVLRAGKNLVTANKYLVCRYFSELTSLAKAHGVAFRCTAAAGGGIPWLVNLARAKRVDRITRISGIMNGTTNYILDTMRREPVGFEEALRQAQSLGYAEADPSADVDGLDIQRKLIISANIAFDCLLPEQDVLTCGIRGVSSEDIHAFSAHGLVCKLLADGERTENGVAAFVEPTLVPSSQPESAVPSNFNLITFVGENVGRLSFFGQGAGRWPTACNCVQDCIDISSGVASFYTEKMEPAEADNEGVAHQYYVRTALQDDWLDAQREVAFGSGLITRPVSVGQMHHWHRRAFQSDPTCFIAGIK